MNSSNNIRIFLSSNLIAPVCGELSRTLGSFHAKSKHSGNRSRSGPNYSEVKVSTQNRIHALAGLQMYQSRFGKTLDWADSTNQSC